MFEYQGTRATRIANKSPVLLRRTLYASRNSNNCWLKAVEDDVVWLDSLGVDHGFGSTWQSFFKAARASPAATRNIIKKIALSPAANVSSAPKVGKSDAVETLL